VDEVIGKGYENRLFVGDEPAGGVMAEWNYSVVRVAGYNRRIV
jgi:hypothetical protein